LLLSAIAFAASATATICSVPPCMMVTASATVVCAPGLIVPVEVPANWRPSGSVMVTWKGVVTGALPILAIRTLTLAVAWPLPMITIGSGDT